MDVKKNKIMNKRKVVFTDNDGCSIIFYYDEIQIENQGNYFICEGEIILFLPSWCAFATFDCKNEIDEALCLPSKK